MDLSPLLAPRSIAVVGATDRESYAGTVLRNLERAGYDGDVWGVNPKREEVLGRPCVPTVADLPEPVDALVVAIPAASVAESVLAGAELGCGGAVVLSAGFAEVESGRGHEARLREIALAHDLPVCGPNGNGIVAVAERAMVWGDVVRPLEPGSVAMVTQSGNVGVNALGSRRGMRWHTVVSTGNQTVCDASDWLAALAERDGVRSVALFLESDDDGAKLGEALALCAERSIGVAVLKVGASEAGARAASAHTGSLAGDQRVFRALIEEAGGAWAEDFHDLLELAKALAEPRARPRGDGGLAVLTCSGGDSGVAGDQAAALGLDLPPLSLETVRRLAELLPAAATIGNPLDYTAMLWDDTDALREVVAVVGGDPAIDQLLLLTTTPRTRTRPGTRSARAWSAAPTSRLPRRSSPPPFPTCSRRERRSRSPPAACPRSPACARRCCARERCAGRSRTRPGCARSPWRRGARRRPAATSGSTRPRPRSCFAPAGSRCPTARPQPTPTPPWRSPSGSAGRWR